MLVQWSDRCQEFTWQNLNYHMYSSTQHYARQNYARIAERGSSRLSERKFSTNVSKRHFYFKLAPFRSNKIMLKKTVTFFFVGRFYSFATTHSVFRGRYTIRFIECFAGEENCWKIKRNLPQKVLALTRFFGKKSTDDLLCLQKLPSTQNLLKAQMSTPTTSSGSVTQ